MLFWGGTQEDVKFEFKKLSKTKKSLVIFFAFVAIVLISGWFATAILGFQCLLNTQRVGFIDAIVHLINPHTH